MEMPKTPLERAAKEIAHFSKTFDKSKLSTRKIKKIQSILKSNWTEMVHQLAEWYTKNGMDHSTTVGMNLNTTPATISVTIN